MSRPWPAVPTPCYRRHAKEWMPSGTRMKNRALFDTGMLSELCLKLVHAGQL